MMVLCFTALTLALCLLQADRRGLALTAFAVGLALSVWLFLFDVYNPSEGFRMPWLQV
ncbi:hypothetical protein [Methylobacterium nigriterrae]|uniref:hypothetical protein n=1 Tax=Methylobacterium nigriterrae TaxID=3127512 RepID=UPI0030135183